MTSPLGSGFKFLPARHRQTTPVSEADYVYLAFLIALVSPKLKTNSKPASYQEMEILLNRQTKSFLVNRIQKSRDQWKKIRRAMNGGQSRTQVYNCLLS